MKQITDIQNNLKPSVPKLIKENYFNTLMKMDKLAAVLITYDF